MQVNSRNLVALGTTVDRVLDPCTNVRDGAAILTADYAAAVRRRGEGQLALQAALSAYNTGSFYPGYTNGYLARYYGPDGVPPLAGGLPEAGTNARHPASPPPATNPYTADAAVFVRRAIDVRID